MKTLLRTASVAAAAAFLVAGCSERGSEGITGSSPPDPSFVTLTTVPDNGLTQRAVGGISASDFVTAGVGTDSNTPGTIEVSVPAGASVEAVWLYWARRIEDPADAPPSEIEVEGSTVAGSIVGGPIATTDGEETPTTYLADLTGEGLVGPGNSSFDVEDEAPGALGASVLVFFDTGDTPSELVLYDGADFLWAGAATEALRTAVPVTFTFPSASTARSATLRLLIGDVEPGDTNDRSQLAVTVDGSTTTILDPFTGAQGPAWDDYSRGVSIPAGVTEVTVEPISPTDRGESMVWSAAGLSVQPPPPAEGGEGCTPGYWRQPHHFDSWPEGYDPGDMLTDFFTIPGGLDLARPERDDPEDLTLLEGITLRGGHVNALIRHAVAALLNAASDEVSYDLTPDMVIRTFNDAVDGGSVRVAKDEFEGFNEQGCPLN